MKGNANVQHAGLRDFEDGPREQEGYRESDRGFPERDSVVKVDSLGDLIKIADSMLKPVMHG